MKMTKLIVLFAISLGLIALPTMASAKSTESSVETWKPKKGKKGKKKVLYKISCLIRS